MYLTDKLMREAGPPSIFDNTMLTRFDSECRRKFYYFWRGLDYENTPSYFVFGRAWQDMMEKWYSTKGPIEERLKAALQEGEKSWADQGGRDVKNDNLQNLKVLMMFYAIEYETELFQMIMPGGKVELGFNFPFWKFGGTEISLAGAIDGYFEWERYGEGHLENKTTGLYLGDEYMRQWKFSPQVTQYHWGLAQVLGKEPFGCLMNCASKRLTAKQVQEFQQMGTMPDNVFMRNLETRSEWRLKEFESDCKRIIEDIYREWDRWEWRKTRDQIHCTGGIGKSECLYKQLCIMEQDPWDMDEGQLLGQGIVWRREGEWTPWERGSTDRESENKGTVEQKAEEVELEKEEDLISIVTAGEE